MSSNEQATNEQLGLIKTNSGLYENDDTDIFKALTAGGLIHLLNGPIVTLNSLKTSILLLNKKKFFNITDVYGVNNLTLTCLPEYSVDKIVGLITFTAKNNNTGPVTINTNVVGSVALPVLKLDNTNLEPDEIEKDKTYSFLPFNDIFYILNPSLKETDASLRELINEHINNQIPHFQYATREEMQSYYNSAFRGSYLGRTTFSNNNFSIDIVGTELISGMFCLEFSESNPENSTLTINGITKPLYNFNDEPLEAGEVFDGDIRVIINTQNSYKLQSVTTQIQTLAQNAINNFISSEDPFNKYWNDTRGNLKIQNSLDQHKESNEGHYLASSARDGFMSSVDKDKLDNITGLNTGDETTLTIANKINVTLDMGYI